MNSTSCPLFLFPETQNCSGRAVQCLNEQCICEMGWTGNGDFVSGSPACHLNVMAIQVLFGILFSTSLCFLPIGLFFSYASYQDSHKKRMALGFFMGLTMLLTCCFSLLRVVHPTQSTIGTDPAVTLVFSFATAGVWTTIPLTMSVFLDLMEKGMQMKGEEERARIHFMHTMLSWFLPVFYVLAMFASAAPSFALSDPTNGTLMYASAACHYVVLAFCMASGSLAIHISLPPIIRDIDHVVNSSAHNTESQHQLKSIRFKLTKLVSETRNQMILQGGIAALFGLWLGMQRYSSYEIAIAWTGMSAYFAVIIYALKTEKRKKKSATVKGTTGDGDIVPVSSSA